MPRIDIRSRRTGSPSSIVKPTSTVQFPSPSPQPPSVRSTCRAAGGSTLVAVTRAS